MLNGLQPISAGLSGGIIWVQGEAGAKAVASVHKAPKRMSWGETLDMA